MSTALVRAPKVGDRVAVPAGARFVEFGRVVSTARLGDITLPATGTVVPREAHRFAVLFPEDEGNVFVALDGDTFYGPDQPLAVIPGDVITEEA